MRLVRTGKFPIIPLPAAALLAVLILAPGRAALAADVEEAHYNAVVSLYNAGQWQAALAKIAEREKQDMPDAQRAKYIYARGLALEKGGRAASYREEDGARIMKSAEIGVRVDLGRGAARGTVYSCDFSYDYVKINADYRS